MSLQLALNKSCGFKVILLLGFYWSRQHKKLLQKGFTCVNVSAHVLSFQVIFWPLFLSYPRLCFKIDPLAHLCLCNFLVSGCLDNLFNPFWLFCSWPYDFSFAFFTSTSQKKSLKLQQFLIITDSPLAPSQRLIQKHKASTSGLKPFMCNMQGW